MSEAVIDASVILALAKSERIDDAASSVIDGGIMGAVNIAEVYAKLADLKIHSTRVGPILDTLARIEPLSLQQAQLSGFLRDRTRHLGLSLGDRCCLALALELGAEVYTTDYAWSKLDLGCKIHQLR